MSFADPKSDIAFKKIFGNEQRKEILMSFLNAILDFRRDKTIADVTILNPLQAPRVEGLKVTTLDVQATGQRGISYIVEMQVERQEYYAKRALYYSSKAYVSQIEVAEKYPKLNQVIFIGILDFNLFEGSDYLTRHYILKTISQKTGLTLEEVRALKVK
jgi:predicted transposase/invertase (TIGR01784 family)